MFKTNPEYVCWVKPKTKHANISILPGISASTPVSSATLRNICKKSGQILFNF